MSRPRLHVVAVIPPPLTGQTLATKAMTEKLSQLAPVVSHVFSKSSRFWRLEKHMKLTGRLLAAAAMSRGRDDLYIVPDHASGLWPLRAVLPPISAAFRNVFLHHHGMAALSQRDRRLASISANLGQKGHHIVLSQTMADLLKDGFSVDQTQIHTCGNAALLAKGTSLRSGPRQMATVGFLSNITQAKGIETFCNTIRAANDRGGRFSAIIAGPIIQPVIRQVIDEFCAEDPKRRRYVGPVFASEKEDFLNEIDALLFPSQYANEAQPLSVLEALQSGCPVLSTPAAARSIPLPRTWVLDSADFVETAARTLLTWEQKPHSFMNASAQAEKAWAQAQAQDEAGYASLSRVLA